MLRSNRCKVSWSWCSDNQWNNIWINKFTLVNNEASRCFIYFKARNIPSKFKTVIFPHFLMLIIIYNLRKTPGSFREKLKSLGFWLKKPISKILSIITIFLKSLRQSVLTTFHCVFWVQFQKYLMNWFREKF